MAFCVSHTPGLQHVLWLYRAKQQLEESCLQHTAETPERFSTALQWDLWSPYCMSFSEGLLTLLTRGIASVEMCSRIQRDCYSKGWCTFCKITAVQGARQEEEGQDQLQL